MSTCRFVVVLGNCARRSSSKNLYFKRIHRTVDLKTVLSIHYTSIITIYFIYIVILSFYYKIVCIAQIRRIVRVAVVVRKYVEYIIIVGITFVLCPRLNGGYIIYYMMHTHDTTHRRAATGPWVSHVKTYTRIYIYI